MSKKEELIEEMKKQIEILKQEITLKQMFLHELIEQLDNMEEV